MHRGMNKTQQLQSVSITADDGYLLSALFGCPEIEPIGSVVISPATGIRKEFYINFSRHLLKQGYRVLIFDYRGIGGSAPTRLKEMNAHMHEWGTLDMNAVVNYMVKEKGCTNIVWVGHSVGGQLIGFLKNIEHIGKVIAINSAFGYWKLLPFPKNFMVWSLWFFLGPIMIFFFGYGRMRLIGWGENLPKQMLLQWRTWCLSCNYFQSCIEQTISTDKFYDFTSPILFLYLSDDFIANDISARRMINFFPNAPRAIYKLDVADYTNERVGHIGIFRKKFEASLWPVLTEIISN